MIIFTHLINHNELFTLPLAILQNKLPPIIPKYFITFSCQLVENLSSKANFFQISMKGRNRDNDVMMNRKPPDKFINICIRVSSI
jgi:hypothetical protein